ncbi:MAG: radical SAM protein [Fibrobacter sp.]|nr:radical SAM protein [Fibrobacter sp.]
MFPFFMAYAAALLEKHGHEAEAIDGVPLNMQESDFLEQVVAASSEMILFEPATTSFDYILSIASNIKKKTNALIVFAGPHASIFASDILQQYQYIDYVLMGEYEFTLLELIQDVFENKKANLPAIKGLAYRSDKTTPIINAKRLDADINELPFPARHLFPSKKCNDLKYYHDGFCQNSPAIQMHSSRGCPFKCSFCLLTQVMYTNGNYRTFTSQRVVEEMNLVVDRFSAKEIYFDDDTFTGNKKNVLELCREIKACGPNIPWSAMGDAIVTDSEMLMAMKDAGCIGLKLGLESGHPDILRRINKPIKLARLEELITICKRLKIKTHITVSFGHEGETRETVNHTLRYVNSLDSDSIQFSLATPYPGTFFYENVKRSGMLIANSWTEYDPTHNPIVKHDDFPLEYLRIIEARSHKYWLYRKILKPEWFFRQCVYLIRLLRKQGVNGFLKRMRRFFGIIFSNRFR